MINLHEAIVDNLIRHWASEGDGEEATFKIRQIETDIIYDEAYDVIPCRYTYEATDIPIEQEETP